MTTRLQLLAPAKLNLHLFIGSKRKDGYHSLQTIFQEISLHDELIFRRTSGRIRLKTNHKTIPTGPTNLIVKALQALKKEMGTSYGMDVFLKKKIPMGAGLGGGSSDAAAALLGGWKLWSSGKKKPIPPRLFQLAKSLGADVPFFLKGGRAWATGIGEKLRPLPRGKKAWYVVVYPRVHVSTVEAYKRLDQSRGGKSVRRPSHKGFFNSFEAVVLKRYPAVRRTHEKLKDLGCRKVLLSGSGSAVFGTVSNKAQGQQILTSLKSSPWDAFLVSTS